MAGNVSKTLFQRFEDQVRNAGQSIQKAKDWFRRQAKSITGVSGNELMRDNKERLLPTPILKPVHIGRMFLFFYDPKLKETLPYYDRFPLMIPIHFYKDGWLGLNLHYLPLVLRARLLDALYTLYQDKYLDEKKKLALTYNILKSSSRYRFFKPCVKKYLYTHVRSKFFMVPPDQWDMMLTLPIERFEKKSKTQVWRESERKLNMTRNSSRHLRMSSGMAEKRKSKMGKKVKSGMGRRKK